MTGSELLGNRHRTVVERKHLNEQVSFGNNLHENVRGKRRRGGGVEMSKYLYSLRPNTDNIRS